MILDVVTAIFMGTVAGWLGISKFLVQMGAGIVGGLLALALCYGVVTLGFRIEKALRKDEPLSPEDQRIVDAVKKANALIREELLRHGN